MSAPSTSPSCVPAVGATFAGLMILAVCLLNIANLTPATQSTQMPLTAGLIFIDLILIALAVLQWVVYLQKLVDFRIDQLRQDIMATTPSASAPARV